MIERSWNVYKSVHGDEYEPKSGQRREDFKRS